MNWLLKYKLNRLSRRAGPDRKFLKTMEKRLAQEGYLPSKQAAGGRRQASGWRFGTAMATFVLFLTSGVGAYAYTSDNVLPESPLYPVREGIEAVELKFARSPERKELVRLKQIQRRLHEARILQERKRPLPPQHADMIIRELREAVEEKSVDDKTAGDKPADEAANDNETYLREELKLERHEMKELVDERDSDLTNEEESKVNRALVEKIDRMEKLVREYKDRRMLKQLRRKLERIRMTPENPED